MQPGGVWVQQDLPPVGIPQAPALVAAVPLPGQAVGAALGAASALRGQPRCGGASGGAAGCRQGMDGPCLTGTGQDSAPAWEAVPAAGSGAPACSGRRSLDSCNVSLACLSFHGVSILQPPSVLIPGGRGRGCLPWHRMVGAGIQAVLGMPEFYVQQQF